MVNSCNKVGRKRGERKKKPCAARLQEDGRNAVIKIRKAVSMKIAIKESKKGNIVAMRKRLKTISQRRGIVVYLLKKYYILTAKLN